MFLVQTLGSTGCLGKARPSSGVQQGDCCQAVRVPRGPPVPADVSLSLPGTQGSLCTPIVRTPLYSLCRLARHSSLTPRPPESAVSPLSPGPCARSPHWCAQFPVVGVQLECRILLLVTQLLDVSLSTLWELVIDSEAWRAAVHRVPKWGPTTE